MILVIGGGAAGMLAAYTAATRGASVVLLEKKNRLGTKILISGGGKCNVTHAGSMEEVRATFRVNEGRFLRPSFYRFTNDDFVRMLADKGLEVYARPDGRLFPVPPADAKDVVAVLEAYLDDAGVKVWREASVAAIETHDGAVTGVRLQDGTLIAAQHVILAAGGSSYPATGTTGDGWRWAASLGHTIVALRAALAPLYLEPTPPASWSGVALRDVVLRARRTNPDGQPGKERMRWRGDLLWTHKGVSGPTALGVSREVAEAIPEGSTVEVDLLPDRTDEQVREIVLRAATREKADRTVMAILASLVSREALPERLLTPFLESAGIDPTRRGAYLAQKERNRLATYLKGWPLGTVRHVPLERGEVVAGGVSLDEVDPQTMESRKISGLYLCGEVLDIAGPVGGYNLQAAWSTGFVAGETAARAVLSAASEGAGTEHTAPK